MKSYEQMAERVLRKIAVEKERRRRQRKVRIGVISLCCIGLMVGVFSIFSLPGPYWMNGSRISEEYSYPEVDLEDFYREPEYIIQGTVMGIKDDYFLNPLDIRGKENARITIYEIKLAEVYKGKLPGETVLVKVVNGEGWYTAWYKDAVKCGDLKEYTLDVGTEYILGLKIGTDQDTLYKVGDYRVFFREIFTFTKGENGLWQNNGMKALEFDAATLQENILKNFEAIVDEADLVVRAVVKERAKTYYTFSQGDSEAARAYVQEYTLEVMEVLKGDYTDTLLPLRAYEYGGITKIEYFQEEIENGTVDLLTLEDGEEYIFCIEKMTEEKLDFYGEETEGYKLVEQSGGWRGAHYMRRACYKKDAEGIYRNLNNSKKIINPRTLEITG